MDTEQIEKPVIETKVSAPLLDQEHAKINSLIGLTFIAASLVFMSRVTYSANAPAFVQSFISSGNNGATLFFVLSGFVLCYNYYYAFSTRFVPTLKSFFVARFTRMYPLHVFLFLLFFAATVASAQPHPLRPILAQLTLTQAWSSHPEVVFSYNNPAWIFSVAAFLSLCFPLLVLLLFKHVTKLWQLSMIGFVAFSAVFLFATWFSIHSLTTTNFLWFYTFPVTRLGDFILGGVAARIYVLQMSKPVSRREQTLGVGLLLLCIAAVIVLMASGDPFLNLYKLDTGFSLFFVVIIYALARYASPLRTFLSTKVLVLLGEASYAFFLLQYLFLTHGLSMVSISARLSGDLYTIMQFLLAVVAALGAYLYVEKPLREKLQRVFASKASAPAPGSPVPTAVGS